MLKACKDSSVSRINQSKFNSIYSLEENIMPSLKCQIFSFQIFRQNFRILLTMEPIANHSLKNNDKKNWKIYLQNI